MQRRGTYSLVLLVIWLVMGVGWFLSVEKVDAADLRVLFVGNSYTYGNDLNKIVKNLLENGIPAYKDVYQNRYAPGGYRFVQHRKDAEDTSGNSPLRDFLVTGQDPNYKWDFVLFQEQSQIPGFPQNNSNWIASQNGLRGLHQLVQKKSGHTVLLMTWGRRKGDSTNPGLFPTYKAMQARLTAGYKAYASTIGTAQAPVFVAPAGLAWERVFDDIASQQKDPTVDNTRFSKMYEGDGSHPSMPGSYLTACVIYMTLTGRNPTLITWFPNNSLPATEWQYYQKVAFAAVDKTVFSGYNYPWAHEWNDYKWPTFNGKGNAVAAEDILPLVRVNRDVGTVDALWLGATLSNGKTGDGRLLIDTNGKLIVKEAIHVGDVGTGEVRQRGGVVQAKAVMGGQGKGSYSLNGGELQTTSLEGGNLTFNMTGGRLTTQSVDFSMIQQGGTLAPGPGIGKTVFKKSYQLDAKASIVLDVDDPTQGGEGKGADFVQSDSAMKIAGTLEVKLKAGVTLTPGKSVVLLRAKTIELVQGWQFKAPALVKWTKKDDFGTQVLVIFLEGSTPETTQESITETKSEAPTQDTTTTDASIPKETRTPESDGYEKRPIFETNDEAPVFEQTPEGIPNQGCCQVSDVPSPFLFLLMFVIGGWFLSWRRTSWTEAKR